MTKIGEVIVGRSGGKLFCSLSCFWVQSKRERQHHRTQPATATLEIGRFSRPLSRSRRNSPAHRLAQFGSLHIDKTGSTICVGSHGKAFDDKAQLQASILPLHVIYHHHANVTSQNWLERCCKSCHDQILHENSPRQTDTLNQIDKSYGEKRSKKITILISADFL